MRRWLALAAIAAALVVAGTGCGGGGGGGPTAPPPPPAPVERVTFTPSSTAGANSIHLAQVSVAGMPRLLRLEVRANEIADLFGVGFDLDFPQGNLEWVEAGTVEGDFLSADGTPTELIVLERPAGNLIVGLTRLGPVAGVDGSGVLLTLDFTATASGNEPIVFAANNALDSTGDEVEGVAWIDGRVEVVLP